MRISISATVLAAFLLTSNLVGQEAAAAPNPEATAPANSAKPYVFTANDLATFYKTQAEMQTSQLNVEHSPQWEVYKKAQEALTNAQKELEASTPGQKLKADQTTAKNYLDEMRTKCGTFQLQGDESGKPVCKAAATAQAQKPK